MLLLGLSGPRGAGKTTAAYLLQQQAGFVPVSFVDPIRRDVLRLYKAWDFGAFASGVKDVTDPRYGISPRDALKAFGDHARALDAQIYCVDMHRRLRALEQEQTARVVIHDVRMPSEAELIRSLGGYVVHVQRSGASWSGEHVTEAGPGEVFGDLFLPNPGSLETYQTMCSALLASVQVIRRAVRQVDSAA